MKRLLISILIAGAVLLSACKAADSTPTVDIDAQITQTTGVATDPKLHWRRLYRPLFRRRIRPCQQSPHCRQNPRSHRHTGAGDDGNKRTYGDFRHQANRLY